MSFKAKLEIDGESYNVLYYDLEFYQNTGHNSKPASQTEGGHINLRIELNKKTDFMNWVISSTQTKDGVITFFNRDSESTMQAITFKKGYCSRYKEIFYSDNNSPMMLELEIIAKELEGNTAAFQRNWGGF
ncbi:type VI secretion system tube protein TssD [Xanthovirga aplysinae]|uniref:type VI secretion system tube protein TssD n=1 Tax=Xanthovirga aplysinae TaxID=2529853 RepID=UPI0012BCCB5D|nr:type VI secretion system tube protein TssD [Xanthovirga aplysinae]MTI31216.1 hypothetical protein [Xanthovirga aplysinae]